MRGRRSASRAAALAAAALLAGACGCMAHHRDDLVIGADVTGENRRLLVERFEKGRVLYGANCASCHGDRGQGRDSIPRFTEEQVQSYMARGDIRKDQRNHAVGRELSPAQLDCIFSFLRMRRVEAR